MLIFVLTCHYHLTDASKMICCLNISVMIDSVVISYLSATNMGLSAILSAKEGFIDHLSANYFSFG